MFNLRNYYTLNVQIVRQNILMDKIRSIEARFCSQKYLKTNNMNILKIDCKNNIMTSIHAA